MSYFDIAQGFKSKIEKALADENLVLTVREKYPITLIISQSQSPYAQMEFLSSGDSSVSSKDSALRFVFDIDGLEIHTSERLIITDALMTKLKGLAKKFHTAYTHAFFAEHSRDYSEASNDENSTADNDNEDSDNENEDSDTYIDPDVIVIDPDDIDVDLDGAIDIPKGYHDGGVIPVGDDTITIPGDIYHDSGTINIPVDEADPFDEFMADSEPAEDDSDPDTIGEE